MTTSTLTTTLANNHTTITNQTFNNTDGGGSSIQLPGCGDSMGDVRAEVVLYIVFIALLMLCSVVGNLLTVFSILMSSALKRRVTFYFIASLACSDFCFAIFQLPFRISTALNGNRFCHAVPVCYLMIISDAIVNVASILNLLLISLDRFIAIKFPFIYTEKMTASMAKRLIAAAWCFAFIWSLLGVFRWESNGPLIGIKTEPVCSNENYHFYAASSFGIYVTVLIIITTAYVFILHVALKQIRAIEKTQVSFQSSLLAPNGGGDKSSPDVNDKLKKRRKRKLNRELRATKSVAIVFLAYVICWLPLYVINIILLVDTRHFLELRYNDKELFFFIYYAFVEILPAVNTMINPFIYSFSNKQFRDAFKRILAKTLGIKMSIRRQDEFLHSVDMHSMPNSPTP